MKKAFTIVELVVAMAVIVIILAGSGYVFHTAVQAERVSRATAEISRKLRGITDQLNADFEGLKKDGEIVIVWAPGIDTAGDDIVDVYERLDRIIFFTTGNFSSYNEQATTAGGAKLVKGNTARVSYMLARVVDENGDDKKAYQQPANERILARTQHILTADPELPDLPFGTPYLYDDATFASHNLNNEYDKSYGTYAAWKNIPGSDKNHILSMIMDIKADPADVPPNENKWGTLADPDDPQSIHKLFCEGVGEFSIQGRYYDANLSVERWFPMYHPDGDTADFADSDFITDGTGISVLAPPVLHYPDSLLRMGPVVTYYDQALLNEGNFNNIPGLGRAFKFTFTLYDSYGIFPEGKTFSHIIYLD